MGARPAAISTAGRRSVAENDGEQSEGAVKDEIDEIVNNVFEGGFLASMELQEMQMEEEDAIEPFVARRDFIGDLREVVSQFCCTIEELKVQNGRLQSENETLEKSSKEHRAANNNLKSKLEKKSGRAHYCFE